MKIAVIGNITDDLTVSKDNFIKEGGRVSFFEDEVNKNVGGPASNASSVINKFNQNEHQIDFYGQIGNDTSGNFVKQELLKEGTNFKHINISNKIMTPYSFIIINKKENTRTICSIRTKSDYLKSEIENINYETDYNIILTDGKYVENSIELIKKNPQAISIIDAGRVNEGIIKLCHHIDYIICSEDFASEITQIEMNTPVNDYLAYKKLKETFKNAKGIAITVGARGYICENNNHITNYPAFKLENKVIDTNAAGDIFHGAFTYALASNYSYQDSLKFANITAALSTTKIGGRKSIPELEEVLKQYNKNTNINTKILKKHWNQCFLYD